VFVSYNMEDFEPLRDFGLTQAGWNVLVVGIIDNVSDCNDTHEWLEHANVFEVVSTRPTSAGLTLLGRAYSEGISRTSTDMLTYIFDYIFSLAACNLHSDFAEMDAFLSAAESGRLSPELLVGLSRITYRWRDRLPSWNRFVRAAISEIQRRGGLDAGGLFDGISPVPIE
jgi:hypothetical protein